MTSESEQKLSLLALTAMVVGSMVGAGIFSLPRTFGSATGPFGAIVAWCIAGAGMFTLARVFRVLAERKPHLDAGVYAYAKAGFGDYAGFLSAFGYWLVGCIADVSYWVLIKAALGAFFPIFGDGDTIAAVLVSSIGLWLFLLHLDLLDDNGRRWNCRLLSKRDRTHVKCGGTRQADNHLTDARNMSDHRRSSPERHCQNVSRVAVMAVPCAS